MSELTSLLLIDNEKRNKENRTCEIPVEKGQIKLTYICMRSLANVWIAVENGHSMARAILIYISYVKVMMCISFMIKSLVANMVSYI